jgi:hypothetical protein
METQSIVCFIEEKVSDDIRVTAYWGYIIFLTSFTDEIITGQTANNSLPRQ